jgi:myo-inositol-1(or 4)-monophosphatase
LAYRLSLVAEGQYDGMITFRDSWEWDICAGALITAEAGAVVSDTLGDPLTFNKRRPIAKGVISAAPFVHSDFLYLSNTY